MSEVRVLQALAGAAQGGAELFFERLASAVQQAAPQAGDIRQHLLIRRNPAREQRLRQAGLSLQSLRFGGKLDFWTGRQFAAAVNVFRPHVVLTWMNRATAFCPPHSAGGGFVKIARLGGYYNLKYYQDCDHLVCNTQDIVDYVVSEGWSAERVTYLPNFVPNFAETARSPLPRAQEATPEGVSLVLAIGRLHENKGFDTLLRALALVPKAWLWLAGDGPQRAALEALADDLGLGHRVRFLGWREDTAALHAAADLFVCPSRHEPLGNVVIEAWANRSPVVATASQGPAALIRDHQSGLLVPVDDERELGRCLSLALSDPALRARIGQAGYASYQESFTEERVVEQYLDFFRRQREADPRTASKL